MKLNIKKALVLISVTLSIAAVMCINVTVAAHRGNYIENNGVTAYSAAKKSVSESVQNEDSGFDPQFLAIGVLSAVIVVDVTAITVIICKRVKHRRKTENKHSVNNNIGGESNE